MEVHKDELSRYGGVQVDSGVVICSPRGHIICQNRGLTVPSVIPSPISKDRHPQLQSQAVSGKALSKVESGTGWDFKDLKGLIRFILKIAPTVNASDAVLIQSVSIEDFRSIERDCGLGTQDKKYPRYTYYAPDEELLIDVMVPGPPHEAGVKLLFEAGMKAELDVKQVFGCDPLILKWVPSNQIDFKEDSVHADSIIQSDFAIGILDKETGEHIHKIVGEVAVAQCKEDLDKRINTILEQNKSCSVVITIVLTELEKYHNPIPIGDEKFRLYVLDSEYKDFAVLEHDSLGPIEVADCVWSHRRNAFAEIWHRDGNGKAEKLQRMYFFSDGEQEPSELSLDLAPYCNQFKPRQFRFALPKNCFRSPLKEALQAEAYGRSRKAAKDRRSLGDDNPRDLSY